MAGGAAGLAAGAWVAGFAAAGGAFAWVAGALLPGGAFFAVGAVAGLVLPVSACLFFRKKENTTICLSQNLHLEFT